MKDKVIGVIILHKTCLGLRSYTVMLVGNGTVTVTLSEDEMA